MQGTGIWSVTLSTGGRQSRSTMEGMRGAEDHGRSQGPPEAVSAYTSGATMVRVLRWHYAKPDG